MGRKQTIDRNVIMTAIETVIRRDGACALSVGAIAREAGISKAGVLYDFGNRSALLAAYVERWVDARRAALVDRAEHRADRPDAWLAALLDRASEVPSEQKRSCALVLSASLAESEACGALVRAAFAEDFSRIREQAELPRSAMVAFLALAGLQALEYNGFHHFTSGERQALLRDIAVLAETDLAPAIDESELERTT